RPLVRSYGSGWAAVMKLVDRDHALGGPIMGGRPEIWAEVVHAVEREMALRLTDLLVRRLHLFYEANAHATGAARPVAEKMAGLLGWDAARRAHELTDYPTLAERSRASLAEPLPRNT